MHLTSTPRTMMINDRKIIISTGASRQAKVWTPQTLLISELYAKLQTPARGQETLDSYMSMLTWCFFNATTVSNSFKEIKIDKEHRKSRIDAADATIDAHKLAMAKTETKPPDVSQYLNDDIIERLWGIKQ